MTKAFLLGLTLLTAIAVQAQKIYDITQFGAVGDGVTNDAVAIQQAIDRCTAEGGGYHRKILIALRF